MKIVTFLFMLFLQYGLFAQNDGNIWYFGLRAGIDFNSGDAVALTDGKMATNEGCATICDNSGKLLFYTDGSSIWNAKHDIMPNGRGLFGSSTTTQSAIIIKKPRSSTIYYVFTVDDAVGPDGLCYSEVDMSLQDGLGDVNHKKNVSVVGSTSERITAVKHRNGIDFWVITDIANTNILHSYLLTANGLNPKPVINNVGNLPNSRYAGYLKASQDGSRLAIAFHDSYVGLFSFNNSTGVINNPMIFDGFINPYITTHGVEFSPNGNILYVSCDDGGSPSILYQYNLLAGSQAAIDSSKINLGGSKDDVSALQIAPNGKIYKANYQKDYLGVIENPNILGVGCAYKVNGFKIGLGTRSMLGLPNFYSSIFQLPTFSFTNLCFGDSTAFIISSLSAVDSVLWDFDDPNSGVNNTSNDTAPVHIFTDTATFNVRLITYVAGIPDTVRMALKINSVPNVFLGRDTTICPNDSLILNANWINSSFTWQDATTNPTYTVTKPGLYWVKVTLDKCKQVDTIKVARGDSFSVFLGKDTTLCKNETLLLHVAITGVEYVWQDDSKNSSYLVSQSGEYWVKANTHCGTATDSIKVDFESVLTVNLGKDTTLCIGQELTLNPTTSVASFKWQDGSMNSNFITKESGSYWVEVSNSCSSGADTINVNFEDCNCYLRVANAFTPNADAINDGFSPNFDCDFSEYSFMVFNRWGEKIFTTNTSSVAWDGTFRGMASPNGVYIYVLAYRFKNNKMATKFVSGNFTLIK